MKKYFIPIFMLALLLSACSSQKSTAASMDAISQFNGEVPETTALAIGTMYLEKSDEAVSSEQAEILLPLWKLLNNMSSSDTAAQAELEAVVKQIRTEMSQDQLKIIEELSLSGADMRTMMDELGISFGAGRGRAEENEDGNNGSGSGGFSPGGGMPPGATGGSMGMGGMPAGGQSDEDTLTTMEAQRASGIGANPFLMQAVINYLEGMLQ